MKKSILIFCLFFCYFFLKKGFAQESLNSTGKSVSSQDYTMDYSIGQLSYSVNQNESFSINEGVIQIIIEEDILSIEKSLGISAYPNPSTDYLIIKSAEINLMYAMYNMNGQVLKKGIIEDTEFSINMIDLPKSTYQLLITDKNKNQRSFKIIKN